ncbi:MAG: hypothetical protein MUC96_01755 [Myxococcaceae bacterium]|jgi:membrane protein implicated in regulation of membrane protease activity|nr:hypothetical protein [Myxococcaceae bacterium]
MTSNALPRWLVAVLALVGAVVLGPPVLALVLVALAFLLKLGVLALKIGVITLGLAAIVVVLRALFGRPTPTPRPEPTLEALAQRLEAQELEQRRALDRQLEEALQQPPPAR